MAQTAPRTLFRDAGRTAHAAPAPAARAVATHWWRP